MAKAGSKYALKQQAKASGRWQQPQISDKIIPYTEKNENIEYFKEYQDVKVKLNDTTVPARAVGAYYCPPGSKYLYSAIHLIYENGIRDTVKASLVQFEL